MTPTELKNEVRSQLDEFGITDGFWSDTNDLYVYITSSEREAGAIMINKFVSMRRLGIPEESPSLKPLIKLDPLNTTTIGSGYGEYSLPADYVETYGADYDYTGVTGPFNKQATLVTFDEAKTRSKISLLAPDGDNPIYYIIAKKIGFFLQPIGGAANMYEHYYFHLSAAVTSASTVFTLGPECHHAMRDYVIGKALMKDGQINEAQGYLKKFYEEIYNK